MDIINFVCLEDCSSKWSKKGNWVPKIKLNYPKSFTIQTCSGTPMKSIPVAKSYWFWMKHMGDRMICKVFDILREKTNPCQWLFEILIHYRLRINFLYCSIPVIDIYATFIIWTRHVLPGWYFTGCSCYNALRTDARPSWCLHCQRSIWWLITNSMHAGIFNIGFVHRYDRRFDISPFYQ